MYYRKLVDIYENTDCYKFFPINCVYSFNDYIKWSVKKGKRNLSPFKFSNLAEISIEEAVHFFMYYSKEDGIFELEYYFECSNFNCSERLYLQIDDIENDQDIVRCEECFENYKISNIEDYLKVSFRLKNDFWADISTNTQNIKKKSNNVFQAFKGLPDDLKLNSPSSSIRSNFDTGGGEFVGNQNIDSSRSSQSIQIENHFDPTIASSSTDVNGNSNEDKIVYELNFNTVTEERLESENQKSDPGVKLVTVVEINNEHNEIIKEDEDYRYRKARRLVYK